MLTQKLVGIGNVGSIDALRTVKVTRNGEKVDTNVLHFTAAFSEPKPEGQRDDNKKPLWVRFTVWNGLATSMAELLPRAKSVYVEAVLTHDTATGGPRIYEATDAETGEKYAAAQFEATVQDLQITSWKVDAPAAGSNGNGSGKRLPVRGAAVPAGEGAGPNGSSDDDEDLPF